MQKLSSPIKLIKDSFNIFFDKKNLPIFVLVSLPLIPFQIFQYVRTFLPQVTGDVFSLGPLVAIATLVEVLYFVVYLLSTAASIMTAKKIIENGKISFKEAYKFAWKNLWGFFLVSLLVFLVILGGTILLIIPGLIFAVWFSFSQFVFVDKGLGAKASMSESKSLVKGRFWGVIGRFIVFMLFTGLVGIGLSIFPFGVGSYINTLLGGLFLLPSFLLYRELSA